MGFSVVSKGRNVHEAIRNGLDILQANREEVEIEVVELETKGFLGMFGAKPAVVRLFKRKVEKEMMDLILDENPSGTKEQQSILFSEQNDENSKITIPSVHEVGKVWVKDGQIYCKETPTHYPTITPKKGVALYKNGDLVKRRTIISEKDELKVELKNEFKEVTWSIEVDPSLMTAKLHVQPGYNRTRALVDQEPSDHIKLDYTETVEIINLLEMDTILKKMKELGIDTGIQMTEIMKACQITDPGVFEIAKGTEPKKGQDGWLELLVNTEIVENGPKALGNGRVDYREIKTIPNVDAGQVIVKIHPASLGRPGITVTGQMIPPESSKELTILIKQGADLIDHGTKIVALESGRPHIEYRGEVAKVWIMPSLYHASNVDLASGNLRFSGDIEVRGNVEEGMRVEAAGDVLIDGLTNRSIITAGNRMVIRNNVINSHLTAGMSNLMLVEIGKLLGKIADQLEGLSDAINQIYLNTSFKTSDVSKMGLSSLLRILLVKKFHPLTALIKELLEMTAKADQEQLLEYEYKEISIKLEEGFLKISPDEFQGPKDLLDLIQQIKRLYEYSLIPPEPDASIAFPYALNSEIYCNGDISVTGQGIINSKIYSGGKVQVEGMVRGGEVMAAQGAVIGETGSPGGKTTWIRVPYGQSIKVKHVMMGTILQIGNKTHQFLSAESNVYARVDREGNLLFH